ncbi:hypothetical protein ACIOKD_40330 [Streptomyces sp. NPDC087844]|uniref:hypothetical protein n=1 Tax=Streptomyces sp. NPDC087844 TaxID=3365805 RepID=UPI0037F9E9BF
MAVGRRRILVGGPKANELAQFLLELGSRRDLTTARSFAQQFNGDKTRWAKYLNGSEVIPSRTLGRVVKHVCGTDARKYAQDLAHARTLYERAAAEDRAAGAKGDAGGAQVAHRELITAQQRLTDSQVKLAEARDADERARAIIAMLMLMCARAESSIHELDERNNADRAQTQQSLNDARLSLVRTKQELKRARRRLVVAERARKALRKEVEKARRETEKLRRGACGSRLLLDDDAERRPFPDRREIDLGQDGDPVRYQQVLERIVREGERLKRDLDIIQVHTGRLGLGSVVRSPVAIGLALVVLATLVVPVITGFFGEGPDDQPSPTPPGEPGTMGEARWADPCGLLDSASLSRFGKTRLVADYGEINRCDVLVVRKGVEVAEAQVYLDKGPVEFEGIPVRTVGNVTIASFPREEDACVRIIATADDQQVQIIGKQWDTPAPNLCELADAATDHAVGVLDDGPVPRRAKEPSQNSLARIDACTLLDAAALRHAPGVSVHDKRRGFGSWKCEWSSADGGSRIKIEYSRDNFLKDNGKPVNIDGTTGFVAAREDGPDNCVVRLPHRTYTNSYGYATIEFLQLTANSPQPSGQLCDAAKALTATAKNIAKHIAEKWQNRTDGARRKHLSDARKASGMNEPT